METEVFEKLVKQAREDPQFFHALVFDTEKTLAKIDYVDRKSKGALLAITPEEVIGILVRGGRTIGMLEACGVTCGEDSCNSTCKGSCSNTCKKSCKETT